MVPQEDGADMQKVRYPLLIITVCIKFDPAINPKFRSLGFFAFGGDDCGWPFFAGGC